jgi:hypothetical protein
MYENKVNKVLKSVALCLVLLRWPCKDKVFKKLKFEQRVEVWE